MGRRPQRRIICLTGVSRVAVLEEFGQLLIYGWEFVDAADEQFRRWRKRLSLDVACAGSGTHTIDLFQDGASRILDFRVWFEDLEVVEVDGRQIPLDEFIGGGMRWWDAMYAGDARTSGHGIVPGAPDGG